jgi:hypothetical protein
MGIEKKLMFRVPEIEGLPFHPNIDTPTFLNVVPWLQLIPHG